VPILEANNFELKSNLLNMFSQHAFNDLAHEDQYQYIILFEELCNTIKINGIELKVTNLGYFFLRGIELGIG
jgi:hypothetical protein